jgi:hypothetical protein
MGLLEVLTKMLTPQPPIEPPSSEWPREDDPNYYNDTSVNHYYEPPISREQWTPTIDKNVPYRGVEQHGVPFNASAMNVIPIPQIDTDSSDNAPPDNVDIGEETLVKPIAVSVVHTAEPVGRLYKVSTSTWLIDPGTITCIAPKKQTRIKLTVFVPFGGTPGGLLPTGPTINTAVPTLWINANREQVSTAQGFPLTGYSGVLELQTTEPLYAYCPSTAGAAAMINIMEEYVVSTDDDTV